jgi:undecaprenyl-diphosphatase
MSDALRATKVRPTKADAGLFVLAYVAFVAVGVAVGKAIVAWKAFDRRDERLNVWLADHRTRGLDSFTRYGSLVGDTFTKIAVTLAVALLAVAIWRRWLEPLMIVLPLVLEAAAFITITWIVDRPRPDVHRLEGSPVGSSFPSGHVAAAAVYSAIAVVVFWHVAHRWIRGLVVSACAIAVVWVGYSRLYRGMHHLSDVIAGVVLGLLSVWWCHWFLLRMADRPAVADAPPSRAVELAS